MPRLSIHLPDGSEKTIVLPKNGEYFARIGRDEHCEIVLPFQSVSGEHALLQFKEGGYVLEDLGSTNGTKINGLTPMVAATLYDGDEIAWGMPGSGLRKSHLRDFLPNHPGEKKMPSLRSLCGTYSSWRMKPPARPGIIIYGWLFMPS